MAYDPSRIEKKWQTYWEKNQTFRAEIDTSDESFNKKIRNAVTQKIPNIWILGNKEVENRTVTWRRYCVKEQQTVGIDNAYTALKTLRQGRLMDNFEDVELPVS